MARAVPLSSPCRSRPQACSGCYTFRMTDTKFILVVEDDPILKNLLGHTLAGKYQALYASDGNEALALFDEYKPMLVLLD